MPMFSYRGYSAAGETSGTLEAPDRQSAAQTLSSRGIMPVSLTEEAVKEKSSGGLLSNIHFMHHVKIEDLVMFCRQMYSLTKAGIPLLRAIGGLSNTITNPVLRDELKQIGRDLAGGMPMAYSLRNRPDIFSPLFVALINVGENTGELEGSFKQIAEYLSLDMETRKRVKAAIRYPMIVIIFLALAMVVLNIWVIPVFANLFAKFDAELPIYTRILLAVSHFFRTYWYVLLLSVIGISWFWVKWSHSKSGRYTWGKWQMHLPIMGPIVTQSLLARFCRSFAVMIASGITLNQALALVAEAVDNDFLAEKIVKMKTGIEGGQALAHVAADANIFSPLVMQMFAVGDETGQVDTLLLEAAGYYEGEVDYALKNLTAKIEPILLVCVAAMVLVLALGIFTPMWNMYSVMQGQK
ncbi:MAG: type II secretion system F family protein [Succinivibrionaceae bacterium]|nr:type II secretion system F family protein [Succinivibrionaceae bacterium]